MTDELSMRFSNEKLSQIIDEAMIYMCACPAQVAEQLRHLRQLFAYQMQCISKGDHLASVHLRIAESTIHAHAELEQCLEEVLRMEGWDMQTLKMPAGLRELREQLIEQDPMI